MNKLILTVKETYGKEFSDADIEKLTDAIENKGVENEKKIKHNTAYFHSNAQELAGFDIPLFIKGDMLQLDASKSDQEIILLLPGDIEKELESTPILDGWDENSYYLTLKSEKWKR